ncbi:MAG: DUF4965 domain-containing protein [Clostridia bacterium]|nr:DUF4965 domain-containing protein [Clostridia bacterium]
MILRPPSTPLITIDPYFSVWSSTDKLTDSATVHWTGYDNTINAYANIDGTLYRFMGVDPEVPAMKQTKSDFDALSSVYVFSAGGVELTATFTSPLLPGDLEIMTRPVSYLEVITRALDGKKHSVRVSVKVSEQICLDIKGQYPVTTEMLYVNSCETAKMGSSVQNVLARDGDDLRIDWGYFYLTGDSESRVSFENKDDMTFACVQSAELKPHESYLVTFAYDDIYSINYFGKHLKSCWNNNGKTIEEAIEEARSDYSYVLSLCKDFSDKMYTDAVKAGGEKYAEILQLAVRQTIGAHKAVVDENGEILFISKECYSNGCAATVDVSYPSIPFFLLYNPELVKGMMRPIYKFARSDAWKFDFAPHDAGRYPAVDGQRYGLKEGVLLFEKQMPVEECGNMIIMDAAVAVATNDVSFADEHLDLLEQWVKYLIDNGEDPGHQLCTDDFAGHLAHNCNLSLKAIMGIASMGIIYKMKGQVREGRKYITMAKSYAKSWIERASNKDGSYKLAFDAEDTFSMKYNIVWDKLFGLDIMPKSVLASEFASYKKRIHPYGMPLDNRKPYTKSDWLVWTATLAERKEDFEEFVAPLWLFFHLSPSRVPMTDWYYTITACHSEWGKLEHISARKSFRNRTVQGGLFIKLLEHSGIMKFDL